MIEDMAFLNKNRSSGDTALTAKFFQIETGIDTLHSSPPCQMHDPGNQAVTCKKHQKDRRDCPPQFAPGNQPDKVSQQVRFGRKKKPRNGDNPAEYGQAPGCRSMKSE
jgi:hypothetical protein